MRSVHWTNSRALGSRVRRATGLAATLFTVAAALALSTAATAGAVGSFGPHGTPAPATAASGSHVHPSSTVAPLTLSNITVTDLATNEATVYSYANTAPAYSSNDNCNQSNGLLCMTFGAGANSTDGGAFLLLEPSLAAGNVYDDGTMSVSINGSNCGIGTGGSTEDTAAAELDQYVFTSGPTPVQAVAVQFDCTTDTTDISGTIAYNIVPTDPADGYYVFGQQGELTGFGNDNYLVYLDGAVNYNLNAPIVGMAPTPDGGGYWMVGSDGGVYASGDAQFYGSTGNLHLNKPIVGMAATPDGKGYWFVGSDGGIFAYGDAQFYGSTGNLHLNKPIVGMAATSSGRGYWLVASDGGIFAYGDAQFYGSTGNLHLNKPIVGMAPTPDGGGYWFVASDGGIFAYGDAHFYGSTGNLKLTEPIVGMTPNPDGSGYWFTAADGGVFSFGSALFQGSLGGLGITDVAGMSLGM
jgi:hypothetical protein